MECISSEEDGEGENKVKKPLPKELTTVEIQGDTIGKEMATDEFVLVYDKYFDQVNRYLRYRVSNTWDADDLTAQVFTKAFEKFDQCRKRERIGAWIFQIAHNTYVDYLRKRREHLPLDELVISGAHAELPEEIALASEEIAELKLCLEQLTQEQRDVILLKYFGDLQYRQIGEVLGKNNSTVKTMAFRAIHKLRDLWQKHKGGGAID